MTDDLERWGRALRSRFVLEREIGQPGATIDFQAHDVNGSRAVIVHVLAPEPMSASNVACFLSALDRSAALRHEHILAIDSTGQCAGTPYFVTPLIDGVTLTTWLERERQLPFLESARVLSELAKALAHAHHHGVLHGSLTTEDVLWSQTHVKLRGLGLAQALRAARDSSESLDASNDIRAFGVIAYEVLAGRKPFNTPAWSGVSTPPSSGLHSSPSNDPQALAQPIVPVNQLRHHIPPGLAYVVMRCLTPDPARRWCSMDDILRLLENLVTPPRGYEAPQLVNQGQYLCRHPSTLLHESLERFESAARIDPRSARAQVGIADASILLAIYGYDRTETALPRAKSAAEHAIALDATRVEGHIALGLVQFALIWDWSAARRCLETALELASSSEEHAARAHSTYSLFLMVTEGSIEDGLGHALRAVSLDPSSADAHSTLARIRARSGEREEAVTCMRRAVELDPAWDHRRRLGLCLAFANRRAESVEVLRHALDDSEQHPWAISALACELAAGRSRAEAESLFSELVQRAQSGASAPFAQPSLVSRVAASFGRADESIAWLERARAARDPAFLLAHDPELPNAAGSE